VGEHNSRLLLPKTQQSSGGPGTALGFIRYGGQEVERYTCENVQSHKMSVCRKGLSENFW
jgi:hypothetical protein